MMQQWFYQLKRQEQLSLLLGAGAIVIYLVYVLLLRPTSAAVSDLQQQNEIASQSLAKVKILAGELKSLERGSKPKQTNKENLTRLIDSTVKANGLLMSRFQPSSTGDVQVRFENAVFNNIVAWLDQIENQHGVLIKDLSVTGGSNEGLVNVSVRLRKGG